MVTSGNSSRSSVSTAPMLSSPPSAAAVPCPAPPRRCLQHGPSPGGTGQYAPLARVEDQPVLADLHLVAVGQRTASIRSRLTYVPFEAAHVGDREAAVGAAAELDMATGDGHVVQEDVALRVPAGRGQLAVQQEAAARVRPAAHHQQRRARAAARRRRPAPRARATASASGRWPRRRTPRGRRWRSWTSSPRAARRAPRPAAARRSWSRSGWPPRVPQCDRTSLDSHPGMDGPEPSTRT